ALQLVRLCSNDPNLATLISRSMGEKPIVVALGARRAHRDFLDPRLTCVLGNQRSKVDMPGSGHRLSRQLLPDFSAHLITPPADCGSEMDGELVGRESVARQCGDRLCCNPCGCTAPAGMNESDDTRWVRNENRNAVGDADGQGDSLLRRDVPVSLFAAQPRFPAT